MKRGAIFFDLDGTLVDYESCIRDTLDLIWATLAPSATFNKDQFLQVYHRVHRSDEAAQLAGRMSAVDLLDRRQRFERVLEALGNPDSKLAELLADIYQRARLEKTRAFPGALETLEWLRSRGDLWLAVVTEGTGENQRHQLARLGFAALLDDVIVSRDVGVSKPNPGLVRIAVARASVHPSRAVFVGDRPLWDLAPAKSIGLSTVFLRSERYLDELESAPGCVDAIVSGHAPLLNWLQEWSAKLTLPEGDQ